MRKMMRRRRKVIVIMETVQDMLASREDVNIIHGIFNLLKKFAILKGVKH